MTQNEFDAFWPTFKRLGNPARDLRTGQPYKKDHNYKVLYGEDEVFAVLVGKQELERLGIKYTF